jgi:hypothetical protein
MTSAAAIWRLAWPSATSAATSRSRTVSAPDVSSASLRAGEVAAVERDRRQMQQGKANFAPIARGAGKRERLLQQPSVHRRGIDLER